MILITGGSQGLGLACATHLLARTEAEVMITGRRASALRKAQHSLAPELRGRLHLRVCDQADPADLRALCTLITDPAVALEAAILAVGVNPMYTEGPRRLHTVPTATIEATIRTNCTHALILTSAILGRFRAQDAGVLVLIGSRAYRVGLPGAALYCATKAFLSGLAAATSLEYASHGVRVHLVNPGLVRTPRTAKVADTFAARHAVPVGAVSVVAEQIAGILLSPRPPGVEVDL